MIFHQINQLASTTRSNQHYQQPTGTNLRFWDKDRIQEMNQGLRGDGADEDVDGYCPLPIRGALVMTMAMISPSRRDVSPAEQLRRSPRVVPPRFRLKTAVLRPESFLMIFFQGKRHLIPEDGHRGASRWPTRQGTRLGGRARPPPSWTVGGPLWCFLRPIFFIYSKNILREVLGLLELCRIGL